MMKPWPMTEVPEAFSATEARLRERFMADGRPPSVASAISRSFVFYCLGWWTLEGAAMAIHMSGAGRDDARALALQFRDARREA